ncbi:hypothetical protein [Streptomyces sp. NBC_00996]|uniref:hypothetical protein n=1 Tax=Streptomyces sp. NBC_00996 TaxID=2903710 RepID=UPI00386B72B7
MFTRAGLPAAEVDQAASTLVAYVIGTATSEAARLTTLARRPDRTGLGHRPLAHRRTGLGHRPLAHRRTGGPAHPAFARPTPTNATRTPAPPAKPPSPTAWPESSTASEPAFPTPPS